MVVPAIVIAPPTTQRMLMNDTAARNALSRPREKSTKQLNREPSILGDARFRVVGLGTNHGELIEMPVLEPAADQRTRQPLPPAHLHAHARMHQADRRGCRNERQHDDEADGEGDGLDVPAFERVEKEFIPAVDRERGAKIGEEKEENGPRQDPRPQPRIAAPEPEGKAQKTLSRNSIALTFCPVTPARALERINPSLSKKFHLPGRTAITRCRAQAGCARFDDSRRSL